MSTDSGSEQPVTEYSQLREQVRQFEEFLGQLGANKEEQLGRLEYLLSLGYWGFTSTVPVGIRSLLSQVHISGPNLAVQLLQSEGVDPDLISKILNAAGIFSHAASDKPEALYRAFRAKGESRVVHEVQAVSLYDVSRGASLVRMRFIDVEGNCVFDSHASPAIFLGVVNHMLRALLACDRALEARGIQASREEEDEMLQVIHSNLKELQARSEPDAAERS